MSIQPPLTRAPADVAGHAPGPWSPSGAASEPAVTAPTRRRFVGPDVVRAVALIGVVVMNYHGYFILDGGHNDHSTLWGRFFDPWTRAALHPLRRDVRARRRRRRHLADDTACASNDRRRRGRRAKRWTLVRRGLALYAFGLMFDSIWAGTILPYYGVMFVVAAAIFTLATPWIAAIGAASALAGAGIGGGESSVRSTDTRRRGCTRRRAVPARAACSTCSSTAPIRCCRGWRSSAPGSCSGGRCVHRCGSRSPSSSVSRCSASPR